MACPYGSGCIPSVAVATVGPPVRGPEVGQMLLNRFVFSNLLAFGFDWVRFFVIFLYFQQLVAVGTPVTRRPPHGSVREELPHTALTSDA